MNIEPIAAALDSLGLAFRALRLRQANRRSVIRELETCVTSITDVIECQSAMMPLERFRAFQAARQMCLQSLARKEAA